MEKFISMWKNDVFIYCPNGQLDDWAVQYNNNTNAIEGEKLKNYIRGVPIILFDDEFLFFPFRRFPQKHFFLCFDAGCWRSNIIAKVQSFILYTHI